MLAIFSKRNVERGVITDYPQDAFTLVSPDNLDFVHSYAGVYCEKQQLSWHGTTVQVVQARPSRLIDTSSPSSQTEAEITTNSLRVYVHLCSIYCFTYKPTLRTAT